MSDGSSCVGTTEEMYATNTSGMEPTVPGSNSTGRNFMPRDVAERELREINLGGAH
jgi:hypothetical protein